MLHHAARQPGYTTQHPNVRYEHPVSTGYTIHRVLEAVHSVQAMAQADHHLRLCGIRLRQSCCRLPRGCWTQHSVWQSVTTMMLLTFDHQGSVLPNICAAETCLGQVCSVLSTQTGALHLLHGLDYENASSEDQAVV